jgi:signal transduction histidine kinase
MGLSISRAIIEAHGGQLWFSANDDYGVTFRFTMPVDGIHDGCPAESTTGAGLVG